MQQLKAALRLGVTRAPNSRKLCDLLKLERVGRRWADHGKAVGLAAWAPTCLAGVVHQSPTAIVACRPTTFLANGTFGPRETNRGMCLEPCFCQSKTNERWPYQTCYDCESDAQVWARPMLSAEKRHRTPSGKAATKEASGAAGRASELSRRGQPRRKRWVNGGGAFSNKPTEPPRSPRMDARMAQTLCCVHHLAALGRRSKLTAGPRHSGLRILACSSPRWLDAQCSLTAPSARPSLGRHVAPPRLQLDNALVLQGLLEGPLGSLFFL